MLTECLPMSIRQILQQLTTRFLTRQRNALPILRLALMGSLLIVALGSCSQEQQTVEFDVDLSLIHI